MRCDLLMHRHSSFILHPSSLYNAPGGGDDGRRIPAARNKAGTRLARRRGHALRRVCGPWGVVAPLAGGGYSASVVGGVEDLGSPLIEREVREASAWTGRLVVGAILLVPLVWLTHFAGLSGP